MASRPCGPGGADGGDHGALRTETRGCVHWESGPPRHGAVTSAAPQEGELPLLDSLALIPMTDPVSS